MGLFSRKDWNVIGIMFERRDHFQVNGNRGKGSAAVTIRDNVKQHRRTLFWAVFDQKGTFLEGEPGPAHERIPRETLIRLTRELPKLQTVRSILSVLETGRTEKAAKALEWTGYPRSETNE